MGIKLINYTQGTLCMFNGCNFPSLCRSYEEVGGNTRLPRCLKAPETTLEKMADPVSEHPSSRRYACRPQLWQVSTIENKQWQTMPRLGFGFLFLQLWALRDLHSFPQLAEKNGSAVLKYLISGDFQGSNLLSRKINLIGLHKSNYCQKKKKRQTVQISKHFQPTTLRNVLVWLLFLVFLVESVRFP